MLARPPVHLTDFICPASTEWMSDILEIHHFVRHLASASRDRSRFLGATRFTLRRIIGSEYFVQLYYMCVVSNRILVMTIMFMNLARMIGPGWTNRRCFLEQNENLAHWWRISDAAATGALFVRPAITRHLIRYGNYLGLSFLYYNS